MRARRRSLREVPRLLGRRGAVLVLLGIVWVAQGVGIAAAPPRTEPGVEYLVHELMPLELRVAAWVVTGLVAILYGFRQVPAGRDGPGFLALVLMPLYRAASFGWGFVLYAIPGVPSGYPRGLIGAATWATIAGLIMVISGWADPRNRAITHPDSGEVS